MHVSSFGSAQAMRSAHLWFLQQQIHRLEYAGTATAAHLNARQKTAMIEQIDCFGKLWRKGKIGPSCEVHSLIFDCALVGSCERTPATDIYGCLDVKVYVRGAVQAHTHYLQWKRFLADSDDPRLDVHGTLNIISQSLMNHGVLGDAIFRAAAHLCSVSHDEHGPSYADVTRQLLDRIAPSSFHREDAHVMHTGTPAGSATGHCVAPSFPVIYPHPLQR